MLRDGFSETPATAYLAQWIMVGSSPQLVMYDCRSNTIKLQILPGRAGWIKEAGSETLKIALEVSLLRILLALDHI